MLTIYSVNKSKLRNFILTNAEMFFILNFIFNIFSKHLLCRSLKVNMIRTLKYEIYRSLLFFCFAFNYEQEIRKRRFSQKLHLPFAIYSKSAFEHPSACLLIDNFFYAAKALKMQTTEKYIKIFFFICFYFLLCNIANSPQRTNEYFRIIFLQCRGNKLLLNA